MLYPGNSANPDAKAFEPSAVSGFPEFRGLERSKCFIRGNSANPDTKAFEPSAVSGFPEFPGLERSKCFIRGIQKIRIPNFKLGGNPYVKIGYS
jgi:hypothetical protein